MAFAYTKHQNSGCCTVCAWGNVNCWGNEIFPLQHHFNSFSMSRSREEKQVSLSFSPLLFIYCDILYCKRIFIFVAVKWGIACMAESFNLPMPLWITENDGILLLMLLKAEHAVKVEQGNHKLQKPGKIFNSLGTKIGNLTKRIKQMENLIIGSLFHMKNTTSLQIFCCYRTI